MPAMNATAPRRSWLLALAVLAAMLAAAALSLAPARADNENMLPLDADTTLTLPPDLRLELVLADDSDNIVQAGVSQLQAFMVYSGESVPELLHVTVQEGSHVRGNAEWVGGDGSPRLMIPEARYDLRSKGDGSCEHIPLGERYGDPADSNYGMDIDPFDNLNRCKLFLSLTPMPSTESRFEVFEGEGPITFSATLILEAQTGGRAHDDAHEAGATDIEVHYPRVAVPVDPPLRASLTVAVGEVNEVSSVSLDVAQTCGERAGEDRGTINRGSRTAECRTTLPAKNDQTTLTLNILNESGKAAAANSVASALVSTTLGEISIGSSTPAVDTTSCGSQTPLICQIDVSSLNGANSGAVPIVLKHTGAVGTAMVTATVLDSKGNPFRTPPVEIVFAGPAVSFAIGEPSAAVSDRATAEDDNTDKLRLTVSGTDKSGNPAPLARRAPRATITGPDGKAVTAGISTDWADGSAFATSGGSTVVNIEVTAPAEKPLKAGEYTLQLRTAGLSARQTFTVAGPPSMVKIGEAQGTLEVGTRMTVTASVQDANGNPVPDGTPIIWADTATTAGSSPIAQISRASKVKNGEASAIYLVLTQGSAFITVSSGGVSDAKLFTVGAPPVTPAEGLHGREPGFQGYLGTTPVKASELLADLPGISGILLRQGSEWVRYSVAGGRVVPGSVDFEVTRGAVLWLSGI